MVFTIFSYNSFSLMEFVSIIFLCQKNVELLKHLHSFAATIHVLIEIFFKIV